ncbi:dnaJ homolog subfamily C member 22 isoform X2 [Cyprinus carpio]|uniref:DnaJ homolog subfamily C member 22 n=1 Tax=Cyprinus carpio TaxID=7962 RepID=A0A9Q9XT29_CYPCA|nr:dnaJ homolog subfamily C member 22 isoform X2 [Cyprinus carpio]
MAKKIMITYALWAMGGPLGLHHIYLGRDSHALLWILTFGGFGIGWAREFFRIPSYVSEANHAADRAPVRRPQATPPPPPTSDLQKTLITCIITSSIFYGSNLSPLPISIAGSVTAAQHNTFKPLRPEPLGPRLYRLSLGVLAFSAPLGYCVFHNTTATLYYISDCIAALLDFFWFIPWLKGLLEYFLLLPYRLLCVLTGGGFYEESWRKVLEIILNEYSKKEMDALKILSLSEEASLEEVTRSYRELAKLWHPDHNPKQQAEAQKMFIQIQDAYEILLNRHKTKRRQ